MPQSLARIWLHVVFSTKERRAYLQNDEIRDEMFRMLAHQAAEIGCPPAMVGGWVDHVHILCGLARTITVAQLIEQLKTETSKWAKKKSPGLNLFSWQNGYGVFSVSQSNVESVVAYIEGQAKHHGKMSFQDEFRALCEKHKIEIDERYIWD
jgi:REP element-mobilizing transposase RayT